MTPATIEMTMQRVHELLVQEFGRLARPLADEGKLQLLDIPGGRFAVVLRASSEETLTISKAISDNVDFERPGLADFLLHEHADFIFGRFERVGERGLSVEHSVYAEGITGPQLTRVVLVVHSVAAEAYKTLEAVGVIAKTDED